MKELSKDLTVEMLPEGLYRQIAEEIGVENLIKLSELIGGSTFYLPKPESIVRPARDVRIREEFNGYNHVELARKYDVTERWVRKLCGDGKHPGQMDLFEYIGEPEEDDKSE